ncbi:MAG TPA: hypothetical protein VNZ49_10695 [Bacteroidia bacterium]|jgi:hypothetical protein|nr:hypothetical protein [Bacteroidia bacterium]
MENTQTDIPEYISPKNPGRWFHNGWFSRGFLIVAGLFFLLPFINIKCSGTKLASISGTDMVFGKEIKPEKTKIENENSDTLTGDEVSDNINFSENPFEKGDKKNIDPNILAITALASVFFALVLTFFKKRIPLIVSGGFALLAVLCLFFIQIQINSEIEKQMGPMNFVPLTFEFTSYYWLCLLFLTCSAIFSFVRSTILQKT